MGWIETSPHRRLPVSHFCTQRTAEAGIEVMDVYRLGDDLNRFVGGGGGCCCWVVSSRSVWNPVRWRSWGFVYREVGDNSSRFLNSGGCSFGNHVEAGWKFRTMAGLGRKKYLGWHSVPIREISCGPYRLEEDHLLGWCWTIQSRPGVRDEMVPRSNLYWE